LDAAAKSSTDELEAMREQMLLFGKGARSCLGRRIATMEIKTVVVALVRNFDFSIGSPTTDAEMAMTDHFAIMPKGGRCVLRLSRAR
jgi:cytochrome P450